MTAENKEMYKGILPYFGDTLLFNTISLADTAIIALNGEAEVAVVAVCCSVTSLLYSLYQIINKAMQIRASKYIGSKDETALAGHKHTDLGT